GLVAGALFSITAPSLAADELVVGLFGGSFETETKNCHISAFEEKTGATVISKLGNSAQFSASVRATRGKCDFDIIYVDNSLATQLKNEKLLETIDKSKLSNADDVADIAFDDDNQYVAFMTGATAIVYDTSQVDNPPQSWDDLFKPEFEGKVAIGDISGTAGLQFLLALNR